MSEMTGRIAALMHLINEGGRIVKDTPEKAMEKALSATGLCDHEVRHVLAALRDSGWSLVHGDGLDAATEAIEKLVVYRYVLPVDDEATPTRKHRPFDMVRRDEALAAIAALRGDNP